MPLTLPGCLPKFDILAELFVQADDEERSKVLTDAEKLSLRCCNNHAEKKKNAEKYVQLMKTSISSTEGVKTYFKKEEDRLKRVLKGNLPDKKKEDLFKAINIIKSFQIGGNHMKNKPGDEL